MQRERLLIGLTLCWSCYATETVRTTRNFVWIAKTSVNAKPFLVRTIFCTHQNFCKRNETSKIPSTKFGGCKNFVRRENPFFLDIHLSLGHQISQHMDWSERDRMTSRHFNWGRWTSKILNRRILATKAITNCLIVDEARTGFAWKVKDKKAP